MAFFDKIKDLGESVAQKSGELAEASKLTMNIKKKERDLRALKFEIGKYIYEQYKNGQSYDEKIAGLCGDIDAAYEEIAALEAEKEAIGVTEGDIEVVEAEVSDEEFDITAEEEEIINNL